ncbi:MAG: Do family serine endopeptidase [Cytophagales bacterium]|nr:Do family serine endopeptidase [Bernardetiaceae bacterium]MDW8211546.1 Do family serine endopeptidase [Cytophagales bacterium]
MKNWVQTLLAAIIGGIITIGGYKMAGLDKREVVLQQANPAVLTDYRPGVPTEGITRVPFDFTVPAAKTTPAVVNITSKVFPVSQNRERNQQRRYNFPFDFFGDILPFDDDIFNRPQEGIGSGVIISQDGYIITNNHVIENADEITVTLHDKRSYKAKVIGTDPSTDIAVIKIDEKGLATIPFGNSDQVQVGEWVLAVGNPFNLTSTVTAGIVSAKARNISLLRARDNAAIESFIQTDAAVNPGNSGGALVNMNGELVGINTAIASRTGSYAGYSFAVPSNLARKVAEDLIKYGVVQRAFLGIFITDLDSKKAKELNLPITEGVHVDSIVPNGSADAAGLRRGDVITKVDGRPVRSVPELQETIGRKRPGEGVTLLVYRDGIPRDVRITLKSREGTTSIIKKTSTALDKLGIEVEPAPAEELRKLNLTNGLKVTRINRGLIMRDTKMREGFIITKVGGKTVRTVQDLIDVIENSSGGVMIEGYYPDSEGKHYFAIGLD